jgi:hypothetical protein
MFPSASTRRLKSMLFCLLATMLAPFTRVVNHVNWRFRRPYSCSGPGIRQVSDQLEPGMVILTHRKYELTNLFIPGYWTHAAMVTEDRHIIQAVSKGVIIEQASEFFSRLDDFLLLRPAFCGPDAMQCAARHSRRYIGLRYNYRFLPSGTSCYCSELVYRAYTESASAGSLQSWNIDSFRPMLEGLPLSPHRFSWSGDFSQVMVG